MNKLIACLFDLMKNTLFGLSQNTNRWEVKTNKLQEAIAFAKKAHDGQVRKYTGNPYIEHCLEVLAICQTHNMTENECCAAVLHDVIEDTHVTLDDLRDHFGQEVRDLVYYLTDDETEGNRAKRKEAYARKIVRGGERVCLIKCADLISNTSSIVEHDKKFARVYLKEKVYLLYLMKNTLTQPLFGITCYQLASKVKLLEAQDDPILALAESLIPDESFAWS